FRPETGPDQHELRHVQERADQRQPYAAVPRGALQSVQSDRVPGHRPHRAVRRQWEPDQPELRYGDRHFEPDPAAARDAAVGEVHVLRTTMRTTKATKTTKESIHVVLSLALFVSFVVPLFFVALVAFVVPQAPRPAADPAKEKRLEWFREAK